MLNHFTRGVQSLKKPKPFSHLKYSSMDFSIPHLTTNPKPKKPINTYSRLNRLNTPNSKQKHTQQQHNASSFSSEKSLNQSTKIFINQHPTNTKHHNNCNITNTFKPKRNNNSTFLSVEPSSLIHKFYYFTDKTHINSKAKKTRQHNIINLSHSKVNNNNNNNPKVESTSISTTSIKPIISNFISLRNCCSVEKNYIKSRNSNMSTYNSNNNNKNTNHGLIKRNICEMNNSNNNNNNNNHSNIINYNNVPKTSCDVSSFEAIQIEIDKAMKTKNKKYFVLKKALESMMEYCSENNYDTSLITLLEKIISITHLIYIKYTNEITNLKHMNDEYIKQIETLTREYENKQQTLILVYSTEIQSLKKKIELLTRNTTTSEHISESSSENKEKKSTINNSKIACINKENLSDLDALYFFDKVQMKNVNKLNKCALIPILPLAISKNESGDGSSNNNDKMNISLEHIETCKNNNNNNNNQHNKEYRINEYRKVK